MTTIVIEDTSFTKCHNSNEAKLQAKRDFDFTCVISGDLHMTGLAGCHLYSAGTTPQLKSYPINIFPMLPQYHVGKPDTLDIAIDGLERPVEDRKRWLLEHSHEDMIGFVRHRLEYLDILCYGLGI